MRDRQFDDEGGAFARTAHRRDGAAMLLDDTVTQAQAKTGARADLLGRKKRVKDAPQIFFRDARSAVLNDDAYIRSESFGGDFDPALRLMGFDGLAPVIDNVKNHLLHLVQ